MQQQQNKLLIPIAIIIAGGLIGWGIIATNKNTSPIEETPTTPLSQEETADKAISVWDTDYILGNPDAKLMFISFSDFECPFCAIFHQTMHQIINEYGKDGQVAWIFRQFPMSGATAEKKALAVRCAGELGGNAKFWELSDKIFQTKPDEEKQLVEIANSIGLDEKQFLKCLDNDTIIDMVKKEYQSGINTGVLGTPTSQGGTPYTVILTKFGKTYPFSGAQPYNVIKPIIDLILEEN